MSEPDAPGKGGVADAPGTPDARAALKRRAAEAAVDFVQSGMAVGIGTGSTARHAIRRIAGLIRAGELRDIQAFATSRASRDEAVRLGIPLLADDLPRDLDLTIDGADEVDPHLRLIKGGGGALLREKIAAQSSRREIIVVDDSKLSPRLGTRSPVPVEVLHFGWQAQVRYLTSLGAQVAVRRAAGGGPVLTDQGNLILDCRYGPIVDPDALAERLASRAGVVEHGLFLEANWDVIVAGPDAIRHLRPGRDPRGWWADGRGVPL